MIIGTAKIKLHINYSHSLKEKRMVVRSIKSRVINKFNVSIAEVEDNDIHQIIVLGLAAVSNSKSMADSEMQSVLNFIEDNFNVEVLDSYIEIF
ncbi:MAG: DUF503 domain-containing protein [Bacillota bacterium]|nr:DUF503 domain-containing protein [Bacillota bacterium]